MADEQTGGGKTPLQAAALLFALAGALAFGWMIGQGSRPDAFAEQNASDADKATPPVVRAAQKEEPAPPVQVADPIPPLPGGNPETVHPKVPDLPEVKPDRQPDTPVVEPAATRGPNAVVRWRSPLAKALLLLEQGRGSDAATWLVKAVPDSPARRNLLGRVSLAASDFVGAKAAFLPQEKSQAELGPDARFGLALCEQRGEIKSISQVTLEGLLPHPDSWGGAMAALEYARRLDSRLLGDAVYQGERVADAAAKGKHEELARYYYQQALMSDRLLLAEERVCQKRLDELTESILLNARRNHMGFGLPTVNFHKVQPGDSLTRIARQYKVTIGSICRVNGLDAKGILRAGITLKVVGGDVTLKVDRARLTATLLVGGSYLMSVPVGIGPGEKTPSGTFTVRIKIVKPDWYYGGKRIPFGDPKNVLGTRWLGFDDNEKGGLGAGLGVHGTTIPESIPGRESLGCVRMRNQDVEFVYDFLPQGGTVEIR